MDKVILAKERGEAEIKSKALSSGCKFILYVEKRCMKSPSRSWATWKQIKISGFLFSKQPLGSYCAPGAIHKHRPCPVSKAFQREKQT